MTDTNWALMLFTAMFPMLTPGTGKLRSLNQFSSSFKHLMH